MRDDDDLTYGDLAEEASGDGEGGRSGPARELDEGAPFSPPDRPIGTDALDGETLDERLGAEIPDRARSGDVGGELVEPGAEQLADDEPELLGELDPREGGLSAEEAAVRVEDEGDDLGLTDHGDDYVG